MSDKLPHFRAFVSNLVEPFYEKWTLNESIGETPFDKKLRNIAINLACEFGIRKCLDETYTKFKKFISNSEISPNIREIVIFNGDREASVDEIAKLWQIFMNATDIDIEDEIIMSFENIPFDKIVELILNESMKSRSSIVIYTIRGGRNGLLHVIRFFSKELYKLNRKYDLSYATIANVSDSSNHIKKQHENTYTRTL